MIKARALSPGINGEPFRGSPETARLYVPVIASQVDGEAARRAGHR